MGRKPVRNRRNSSCSTSNYQALECRKMLAGDVLAFQWGEHFFVRGDADSNQVQIEVVDGKMVMSGQDGTTINGESSMVIEGSVPTNSVDAKSLFAGGLRVNMGLGDDSLTLIDSQFEQESVVFGGAGHDEINFQDSVFNDRLLLQTFTGNDSITMNATDVYGDFFAHTLGGDDSVAITDSMNASHSVVVTGDGDDHVMVSGNKYDGDTQLVLTLAGDDVIEAINPTVNENGLGLHGGTGADHFHGEFMHGELDGQVFFNGQVGDDLGDMTMVDRLTPMVGTNSIEGVGLFDNAEGDFKYEIESWRDSGMLIGRTFANQFQLEETTDLSVIEWSGTYHVSYTSGSAEYGVPDAHNFIIKVYEDADGLPAEEAIYTELIGNDVERTDGELIETNEVPFYERRVLNFSADVEMTIEAGEKYWIAIYEDNPDTDLGLNPFMWGTRSNTSQSMGVFAGKHIYEGDLTDPARFEVQWESPWRDYSDGTFPFNAEWDLTELAFDFKLRG